MTDALYNTGNSVGSTDAKDLRDNAIVFDEILNGTADEVTNRLGASLKTIAYLQSILTSLDVGSFTFASVTAGLAGTTSGQYFRVPQGSDATTAFIYYLNNNGTAEDVAESAGAVASGYQPASNVSSSADNTVDFTIPGYLTEGTLVYLTPTITNTGAVTVNVTNILGVSVTRKVLKSGNSPLTGGEFLANQPVLMEYRGAPVDNFIMVAAGPVASELNSRLSLVEANSTVILSSVANTNDAYTASASNVSGLLTSSRLFEFTPSATNTTTTPTLSVNSGSALTIKQGNGGGLAPGQLISGFAYILLYNSIAKDFRIVASSSDRNILLGFYNKGTVTSNASSPNAITLTTPGALAEGTQLTFEPVVANTGAVTLAITNIYGNTVTRNLLKGANTALTGGELKASQPVTVVYRGAPINNFKLLYSGDMVTDIANIKEELASSAVAESDILSSVAEKLVGTGVTSDSSPFGTISFSNGVKTVTKKQIICTSIGSSVGLGCGTTDGCKVGATYAPNTLFVDALKAQLSNYGEFDIIDDNQCIATQALQQFSAQLSNSPYTTSDFVLIIGGMNDAPVGNFNMGRTFPAQQATLESLVAECIARGAIPIICTTPHHNVEMEQTQPGIPSGNPLTWPVRTFNVTGNYAFDATAGTITQGYFANSGYGGNILKAGSTLRVESGDNEGNYTIKSFSSDRTVITVEETIPSTGTYSTTVRHFNLNDVIDDVLVPSPAESFATKDWTGGGVSVKGDVRFEMVNNMFRSVARQKGCILADVEQFFFRYGVEVGGYDSVYDAAGGYFNHPSDNGYSISYGKCLEKVAFNIARLIQGDKEITI